MPRLPSYLVAPHHEQSETIPTKGDRWMNVYGQRTENAGKPLPVKHSFEQDTYGDLTDAILAAATRSLLEGLAQQFLGGNLPGRRKTTDPWWAQ